MAFLVFGNSYISRLEKYVKKENHPARRYTFFGVDGMSAKMHVTVTGYKQPTVTRINTGQHPIFQGQFSYMTKVTFKHVVTFFHTLKITCILTNKLIDKLVIGTDDEKSLDKAITERMPEVTNILCTRHTHENVKKKNPEGRCSSQACGTKDWYSQQNIQRRRTDKRP